MPLWLSNTSWCVGRVEIKYKMFTQKHKDAPLAKQYVMVCRQSGNKIQNVYTKT